MIINRLYLFLLILNISILSSVGQTTLNQKNDTIRNDSVSTILEDTTIALHEVVITERKKMFRWDKDGLLIDVGRSDLKDEPDIASLMKRVPGIFVQGNKIEIPGKKSPVYYVNEKKVLNFYEVEMLAIKDIGSIRLIISPGVQYDSDGAPVILIKTKKQLDGVTMQFRPSVVYAKKWSDSESLNLGYHKAKLDVFGMYQHGNSYSWGDGSSSQINRSDTIWNRRERSFDQGRTSSHTFQTGFNYTMKTFSLGLKYDGSFSEIKNLSFRNFDLTNDIQVGSLMKGETDKTSRPNSDLHHINLFYTAVFIDKWKIKIGADYARKNYETRAVTVESMQEKSSSVLSEVRSAWDVFAYQFSLSYSNEKTGDFIVGSNISHVNGYGENQYFYNLLKKGKTGTNENKYSTFLSYNYALGDFNMQAGLRYDWLISRSKDIYSGLQYKNRYPNWMPNVTVSYTKSQLNQSLSYSMSVTRPQYSDLNNNFYYVNTFTYSKGNLELKPSTDHTLNYTLFWKYLFANITYIYSKDPILSNIDIYPGKSYATINSEKNENHHQSLIATLNIQYPIKFWEPSLNLLCYKTFFKYKLDGELRRTGMPLTSIGWNNVFKISKTFRLSVDYKQYFKGDIYYVTSYPNSSLNIRLQKTFFKDKLHLILNCNDVFNKHTIEGVGYFNQVLTRVMSRQNSRQIGFSVIYRFNHSLSKGKYAGENSAKEEMNRLNRDIE